MPVLAAAVSRLREVTGNAESALGKEGRRAEEEQRRSEAWRARVDKLSLQARRGGRGVGEGSLCSGPFHAAAYPHAPWLMNRREGGNVLTTATKPHGGSV